MENEMKTIIFSIISGVFALLACFFSIVLVYSLKNPDPNYDIGPGLALFCFTAIPAIILFFAISLITTFYQYSKTLPTRKFTLIPTVIWTCALLIILFGIGFERWL